MTVHTTLEVETDIHAFDEINEEEEMYWEEYELERDPFPCSIDENPCALSQWNEYIELLQHLIRYSNVLLAVTSKKEDAAALIEQIQTNAQLNLQAYHIEADEHLDPIELLNILSEKCSCAEALDGDADLQDQVYQLIQYLTEKQQKHLLMIEAAQQLPEKTLEIIFQIIRMQPEKQTVLRIVLFGEPLLQTVLEKLDGETEGESLLHTVALKPFSLEEMELYLKYCLNTAGQQGPFPFTRRDINYIYKTSQGCLGQVNQIARQVMTEKIYPSEKGTTLWNSYRLILITGIMIICAAGLYMYNSIQETKDKYTHHATMMRAKEKNNKTQPTTFAKKAKPLNKFSRSNTVVETQAAPLIESFSKTQKAENFNNNEKITAVNSQQKQLSTQKETAYRTLESTPNVVIQPKATDAININVASTTKAATQKEEKNSEVIINKTISKKEKPQIIKTAKKDKKSVVIPKSTIVKKQPTNKVTKISARKRENMIIIHSPLAAAAKESFSTENKVQISASTNKNIPIKKVNASRNTQRSARTNTGQNRNKKTTKVVTINNNGDDFNSSPEELASYKGIDEMKELSPYFLDTVETTQQKTGVTKTNADNVRNTQQASTTSTTSSNDAKTIQQVTAVTTANVQVNNARNIQQATIAANTKNITRVQQSTDITNTHADKTRVIFNNPQKKTIATSQAKNSLHHPEQAAVTSIAKNARNTRLLQQYSSPERTLLSLNDRYYALQLVGSGNKDAVRSLARNFGVTQKTFLLTTNRKGKAWYILVYGQYPTLQEARHAITKLSPSLRGLKPWPRRVANIQQAIRQNNNKQL